MRQEQAPLRARDPDIGEAPLLLELLLVVERPAVREQALLETGNEHHRELQPLRRVERDQHRGVGVSFVAVLVRDERGLLEQSVERVLGAQVVVAGRHRAQLEQVGPAFLAFLGTVREHRPVARRLEGLVEQLGEGQHPDPRSQPTDERRELGKRVPRARRELGLSPGRRLDRAPVRRPFAPAIPRSTSIVFSPMLRAGR